MKLEPVLRGLAALGAMTAAAGAFAHPGHGATPAFSPMHVLEADHLLPLLVPLGLAVAVVAVRTIRRRRADRRRESEERR